MKFLSSVSILILGSFFNLLFAQTTGRGCNLGSSVATEYLGMATYNGNADKKVYVYSSSPSAIIEIVFGQGYSGYRCGYINIYDGGARWDSATQQSIPYQAVNEIINNYANDESHRCVTALSLSQNFDSGQGGEGFEADYSYNNPAYYSNNDPSYPCNAPPNNLPVDQNVIFMLLPLGFFGFLKVRQKSENQLV